MKFNINDLAWKKMDGLLPAIIQDANSNAVLMLGYMNQEALQKTIETKEVTFFSRSKNQLWTKGETSGNKLELVRILTDCDKDTLLIFANPIGPVCHTGVKTCFGEPASPHLEFIITLEKIIRSRQQDAHQNSYVTKLFEDGIPRIAQKVGEEAIEVALASIHKNKAEFCEEVADLLFHMLVILQARDLSLSDILKVLKTRHEKRFNENDAENLKLLS
jgi:phosphoribosyl-ATP pyrophosphohydrolase/phosphoribosyl-AMP cyclohydrolase